MFFYVLSPTKQWPVQKIFTVFMKKSLWFKFFYLQSREKSILPESSNGILAAQGFCPQGT